MEQREGMSMARVIDIVGQALILVAIFAVIGTVGSVDKGTLGITEAFVKIAWWFVAGGVGALMMRLGGRR